MEAMGSGARCVCLCIEVITREDDCDRVRKCANVFSVEKYKINVEKHHEQAPQVAILKKDVL